MYFGEFYGQLCNRNLNALGKLRFALLTDPPDRDINSLFLDGCA